MPARSVNLAALSLLVALMGCGDDDATDAGRLDGGSASDGASPDGDTADHCAGACAADEICLADGRCVECTEAVSCAAGHCDTTSGSCVECTEDEHCTDPATPACGDDSTCEPGCTAGGCATRFDAHPYCDGGSGRCVECTVTNLCDGSRTCDLTTRECVDIAPGGVTSECRPCTNDRQCAGDMRCIPLDFNGGPHGAYCLHPLTTCTQPFAVRLNDRVSINGAGPADYCGIAESLTTCEAAHALVDNLECAASRENGYCRDLTGAEVEVEGAICEALGGLGFRCTIRCENNTQCQPPGSPAPYCDETAGTPGFCRHAP